MNIHCTILVGDNIIREWSGKIMEQEKHGHKEAAFRLQS